jgi:hypothetical protein
MLAAILPFANKMPRKNGTCQSGGYIGPGLFATFCETGFTPIVGQKKHEASR